MAGCCEFDNEHLGSIKCGDVLTSRRTLSFSGRFCPMEIVMFQFIVGTACDSYVTDVLSSLLHFTSLCILV